MREQSKRREPVDLAAIQSRFGQRRGRDFWRSLEELAGTDQFQEFLRREFPENASEWYDEPGRRKFLKLMGASLALAGLTSCTRQPAEKIVPYVRAPEEFIPGRPLFYATAISLQGYATGLLVESHMGRPTKIEGNELHPASLGAADFIAQASILTLYDPDRSQVVQEAGRISTYSSFLNALNRAMIVQKAKQGAGLRILTETVTSPTLAWQLDKLLKDLPAAKWHQYEPVNRDTVRAGARLAFGTVVDTQYRFDRANIVLSLESDFLYTIPGSVRYARDFIARRRAGDAETAMNRLYVLESTPTVTGSKADHRLPIRSSDVEAFARAIANRLGIPRVAETNAGVVSGHAKWIDAVVRDLQKNRGASIVIAGDQQPAAVHAVAHAVNHTLGNAGNTVVHTDPVEAKPMQQTESLRDLVNDIDAGQVELLIILGANPAYNAPSDFAFADRLSKVPFRAHIGLYEDETSYLCHWHVPEIHYLEAWADARSYDGTVTIQQPLIAPLYGGKSAYEVLAGLAGQPGRSGYDILREYWKAQLPEGSFEKTWRQAIHDGVLANTSLPPRTVELRPDFSLTANTAESKGLEIVFRPDPTVFDGRFANNGWLQELPKPMTKLVWDNICAISPRTAERLGLTKEHEEVVELRIDGRSVRAPVWVMPGQADDSVTVFLGYGRRRSGRIGTGIGYDAYSIRMSASPWLVAGLEVVRTGHRHPLATTQHHYYMEGRHLVREATIEEFRKNPDLVREMAHEPVPGLSLYPGFRYDGNAWGMTIDLNACIGCNACVIACQSENNIPIVGKDEVARGREMHWIRVDRYYEGSLENPAVHYQPVPCMHCENAPCEVVCPVAATVHSDEGLNDMVYNRCVGTRYCSNNCPYKVRRFNFFQYTDAETLSLKLMRNPDVTVRSRGVMEKCTYCVQRINAARISAEKDGRPIRDGEILTACQQTCPTQAIVFGNINDPQSSVAKLKADKRNYGLLTDLNTRPRTTYLAKLRNPNPELENA